MQIYHLFSQKNTPEIRHKGEPKTQMSFDKLFQLSIEK